MTKALDIPIACAATFAPRMFMARCVLSTQPRITVYEIDPTAVHVPDYNLERARVVPRKERAWQGRPGTGRNENGFYGGASKALCPPGFASVAGSKQAAVESLLRLMIEHKNAGDTLGVSAAIRVARISLEMMTRVEEHA